LWWVFKSFEKWFLEKKEKRQFVHSQVVHNGLYNTHDLASRPTIGLADWAGWEGGCYQKRLEKCNLGVCRLALKNELWEKHHFQKEF